MNVEQICREVSIILQKLEKTDTTDKNFNFDVDLFDYGYLDSFGVVELLFEIKQVFGLDLSHEDFYHDLRSVRSISAYILTKVGKSETNT
jgi:methoxymalonate biosynthesis acyl carrier protein